MGIILYWIFLAACCLCMLVVFTVGVFRTLNFRKCINNITSYPETDERPDYAFLICARDEAAVIADLVKSMYNQDYPREKIHVYVMADNCTDNTYELAKEAGATVYKRFNDRFIGKGYALEEMFKHLKKDATAEKCRGFFVFDADNILDPHYTFEMNKAICSGAKIATGNRICKNWGESIIGDSLGFFFMNECLSINHKRMIDKTDAMVMGTGWYMDKSVIWEDGWHYVLKTEDMQFSIERLLKGDHIYFVEKADFYDEQVTTFKQTVTQMKRWAKGPQELYENYGKTVEKRLKEETDPLKKKSLSNFYFYFYGASRISPIGTISFVAGTVFGTIIFSCFSLLFLTVLLIVPFILYFSMMCIMAMPLVNHFDKIPLPFYKKLRAFLFYPFYMIMFMFSDTIISVFKINVTWEKILHTGKKVQIK